MEPALSRLQAVTLYDYPASQAALAKIENGAAKRFEFYINGIELCNAFLEELNPEENKKRILEANKKRRILNLKVPPVDYEFIDALNYKSYETCGNALGLDRWLALLLEKQAISDIVPFRKMKPFI